jgi:hypothetical protein
MDTLTKRQFHLQAKYSIIKHPGFVQPNPKDLHYTPSSAGSP